MVCEEDYDLSYIFPYTLIGMIIGLFLSLATTSHIASDDWAGAFPIILCTVLITVSVFLFVSSYIYNSNKQALKLNGWIFGTILTIASIVFFFVDWNYIILPLIAILLILTETMYWCDNKKPEKKQNKLLFTAKIKGLALLISSLMIMIFFGFYNLSKRIYNFLGLNFEVILKWLGYIGLGILGLTTLIGIVMFYLWLNSLKYKKKIRGRKHPEEVIPI